MGGLACARGRPSTSGVVWVGCSCTHLSFVLPVFFSLCFDPFLSPIEHCFVPVFDTCLRLNVQPQCHGGAAGGGRQAPRGGCGLCAVGGGGEGMPACDCFCCVCLCVFVCVSMCRWWWWRVLSPVPCVCVCRMHTRSLFNVTLPHCRFGRFIPVHPPRLPPISMLLCRLDGCTVFHRAVPHSTVRPA